MTTATFTDCSGTFEMVISRKVVTRRGARTERFSWQAVGSRTVITGLVNAFASQASAIRAARQHAGFSNIVEG
jgi:hypothetical protein